MLVMMGACSSKKNYTISDSAYEVEYHKVNMSKYPGVSSVNHQFVQVEAKELFNAYENGGTGIFVLSATWCPHCRTLMKIINEVASERNLTIYYVSGDKEGDYPITDEDIERYKEIFGDYLNEEDGKKVVLMPHVIALGCGEVVYSKISGDDEKNITNEYRKAFSQFTQ